MDNLSRTILSTDQLAAHLDDPAWVIVDCRFDLMKPDWGFEEYQVHHIPGAVYAHLEKDLSGKVTPETGRHPLPDIDELIVRLSNWGIDPGKQVVAYDTSGGSFAVRLWWLLRWLGHTSVAVLDGGFPKWLAENRPVKSGNEKRSPSVFVGKPDPDWVVDATQVETIRKDPAYRLIDARSAPRYWGEEEPIDPVAGHIPGAVNRFHGNNLSSEGIFLSPQALRDQFETLLQGVPAERSVVYCGSGVTSLHHLLAMEIAGLPGARLYAGSWSEWIRDPQRPRSTCQD